MSKISNYSYIIMHCIACNRERTKTKKSNYQNEYLYCKWASKKSWETPSAFRFRKYQTPHIYIASRSGSVTFKERNDTVTISNDFLVKYNMRFTVYIPSDYITNLLYFLYSYSPLHQSIKWQSDHHFIRIKRKIIIIVRLPFR